MGREAGRHREAGTQHLIPQVTTKFREGLKALFAPQDKRMALIAGLEAAGPIEMHRKAAMSQPVADGLGAGNVLADRASVMNRGQRIVQTLAGDGTTVKAMRRLEARAKTFDRRSRFAVRTDGEEQLDRHTGGQRP